MASAQTTKHPELQALEGKLTATTASNSRMAVWLRPVLDAVGRLGEPTPIEVETWLRANYANTLRPQQWAHVLKTKWIRWARDELRKLGAMAGEKGHWELTDLGRKYWEKHRSEPLDVLTDWPELSDEETGDVDAPPITVEATSPAGYEIPLLRHLASGVQDKREMIARIGTELRGQLLPGDLRIVPQGVTAFEQRAAWALTYLSRKEEATNVGHGSWTITDAGRARLSREGRSWSLNQFRGSKTKVRGMMTPIPSSTERSVAIDPPDRSATTSSDLPPPTQPEPVTRTPLPPPVNAPPSARRARPPWDPARWAACKAQLQTHVFDVVQDRLRPDLGPSPNVSLARNLIFYGPPGTGKTRATDIVAHALTGEVPSDAGGHRLVQFHPSYSYEDFVQGLRPDLGDTSLRYQIQPGPFVQICQAARNDPQRFHVLVIDEINRGEPSRIFGEALFGLEKRGQPIGMLGGGELLVPTNLVVVGTMNSVDRSVALMDYALRRRFGFVYFAPDLECIRERWARMNHIDDIIGAITKLNEWLRERLSPEHMVGQSFFLSEAHPLDKPGSLQRVWAIDIAPLLEEYLFHDREQMKEVRKMWAQWTDGIDRSRRDAARP